MRGGVALQRALSGFGLVLAISLDTDMRGAIVTKERRIATSVVFGLSQAVAAFYGEKAMFGGFVR